MCLKKLQLLKTSMMIKTGFRHIRNVETIQCQLVPSDVTAGKIMGENIRIMIDRVMPNKVNRNLGKGKKPIL